MITHLRRLLAEGTPLRWYHLIDDYGEGDRRGSMFLTHEAVLTSKQIPHALGLSWADAALIVAAVNALPALLDVVEAAQLVEWVHRPEELDRALAATEPEREEET